jgi:hypothetical protein
MFEKSIVDFENQSYPIVYKLTSLEHLDEFERLERNPEIQFIDKLDHQVFELLKARHAGNALSEKEIWSLVPNFFEENPRRSYGNWIYYPWTDYFLKRILFS